MTMYKVTIPTLMRQCYVMFCKKTYVLVISDGQKSKRYALIYVRACMHVQYVCVGGVSAFVRSNKYGLGGKEGWTFLGGGESTICALRCTKVLGIGKTSVNIKVTKYVT